MHLIKLLHNFLKKELVFIHKTRLRNVIDMTEVALKTNKLSLTGLGRNLTNKNKTGSNIQKVDRLLANGHLDVERFAFYKCMLEQIIKEESSPWIHVDWLCINASTRLYALRASVSLRGRSIVIYEECYRKEKENTHSTHKAFLNQLKALLPSSVKPVIVTDAGFRAPWFSYILKLGWDFVGRMRNKNLISMKQTNTWQLSSSYYEKATGKPTYLEQGLLNPKSKVPVHFVLYKGKLKGRHKLNQNNKKSQSSKSKRYAQGHKEPWLLASSLEFARNLPHQIVNIYRQRMRIEENIRDTKCPHFGLGLKKSLCKFPERMNILLLIGALATFAAWLAGLFISHLGKISDFQAHSAKFTSVLSKVFLGREAIKRGLKLTKKQFHITLQLLYQEVIKNQMEVFVYV